MLSRIGGGWCVQLAVRVQHTIIWLRGINIKERIGTQYNGDEQHHRQIPNLGI
jgi:hypothetical protein